MYCEGRMKPILRGYFHFFGSVVLTPLLISVMIRDINTVVETAALITLFIGTIASWGTSALFHCYKWSLMDEIAIQRLGLPSLLIGFSLMLLNYWLCFYIDHAAVFVNIGCTFTSIAILIRGQVQPSSSYHLPLLCVIIQWLFCLYGIWHVYNKFSERMHFWILSILVAVPSFPFLGNYMTIHERLFAIAGLFSYAVGALIFGQKLIDPIPKVFGYHEVFHLFTVISGVLSFWLVHSISSSNLQRCRNSEFLVNQLFDNSNTALVPLLAIFGRDFCSYSQRLQWQRAITVI